MQALSPPPNERLSEWQHSSSQLPFNPFKSLPHLLPRQAFPFLDLFSRTTISKPADPLRQFHCVFENIALAKAYVPLYSNGYHAAGKAGKGRIAMNRRLLLKLVVAAFAAMPLALPAAAAEKVTVFASASLKNALDAANAAWQKESGNETAVSYAASSALAKQIEAAAPADLFISADLAWMDYVAEKKLIKDDTRSNLLGNRIVLVAPKDKASTERKNIVASGSPSRSAEVSRSLQGRSASE